MGLYLMVLGAASFVAADGRDALCKCAMQIDD